MTGCGQLAGGLRPWGPGRVAMDVSRRAFFKTAAATAAGTALGGLAGFGANLSPVLARAEELRIKNAKTVPSLCPYCSVGCATLVQYGQRLGTVLHQRG